MRVNARGRSNPFVRQRRAKLSDQAGWLKLYDQSVKDDLVWRAPERRPERWEFVAWAAGWLGGRRPVACPIWALARSIWPQTDIFAELLAESPMFSFMRKDTLYGQAIRSTRFLRS